MFPPVRPDISASRRRLAESTSTSTIVPDRLLVQPRLDLPLQRLQRHDPRASSPPSLTSSGIRFDASVFGRAEYLNENMLWYRAASVSDSVSLEVRRRLPREANDHIGR